MSSAPRTDSVLVSGERGLTLAVEIALVPDGYPLLVHAGSPGSRRLWPAEVRRAAEAGFCLLSYDRPGYGGSPRRPGRTVADAAADVAAIARVLGHSELAVWGFSGGGPFALASAALLPGLVKACCVVASLAPREALGADWASSWSADNQREVDLFFADRYLAREHFRAEAEEMFAQMRSVDSWLERWGSRAEGDEAHSREMAAHLVAVSEDVAQQGDHGWWDDWSALLTPWGFDPATMAVPVQLWHGLDDAAAPPMHGRWLSENIPHVQAHFLAGSDHTDIEVIAQRDAYEWLTAQVADDIRRFS